MSNSLNFYIYFKTYRSKQINENNRKLDQRNNQE